MKNNNTEISISDLYNDGGFRLCKVNGPNVKVNRAIDSNQAVSILMFDLTTDGKINNLYLIENENYLNQSKQVSCLIEDVDSYQDDDEYDTFKRCLYKDLAIKNLKNLDSCYYLGKVNHSVPFHKDYHCYALCVNDYIKSPNGFELDLPEKELQSKGFSIKKIKFSRAIKGECQDSLVLACCSLLLSYIS